VLTTTAMGRGTGFTDAATRWDVFIPRDGIQDAMPGGPRTGKDQRLGGVTGAQRAEGRIIRILGRRTPGSVCFATPATKCVLPSMFESNRGGIPAARIDARAVEEAGLQRARMKPAFE